MTIAEVISRCNELKPNSMPEYIIVSWLSVLDGVVKKEIIDTHEGGENINFTGYEGADLNTDLLIPFPYDKVYLSYVISQIDYFNGDLDKYNNSVMIYNVDFNNYHSYYNRTFACKNSQNMKW